MEHSLPIRFNPNDDHLTEGASKWIASRIMPGKGNAGNSFVWHRISDLGGFAHTFTTSDMTDFTGTAGYDNGDGVFGFDDLDEDLEWTGYWSRYGEPMIGHAVSGLGIVAPFNSFNAGYRYKGGWRPNRVG